MSLLDLIAAGVVGILFTVGAYGMMAKNLQRIVIGFLILSNGVNLSIIAASGLPHYAQPPLIQSDATTLTDPLPQAFVLTAIVIGLGLAAFLAALTLRYFQASGEDVLTEGRDDTA